LLRFCLPLALLLATPTVYAQQMFSDSEPLPPPPSFAILTAAPDFHFYPPGQEQNSQTAQQKEQQPSRSASNSQTTGANTMQSCTESQSQCLQKPAPQPKRILGVMPNFRAVSAGTLPPPPTPKQAFMIATRNSFDYSSFIFVGITSMLAEGTNAHPQLGKGVPGFGRYYWRGFLDKTDGNYMVVFVLPTIFHQDERYYAMGTGSFWKRAFYSSTRIFVTPNYEGHNSFNISELLGKAIAQAVSVSYYPSQDRTAGSVATKYGYAIGRDMLTNVFREFWPDIATHVLHRHP